LRAVFDALYKTYSYLTPDLWPSRPADKGIFMKFHNELKTIRY